MRIQRTWLVFVVVVAALGLAACTPTEKGKADAADATPAKVDQPPEKDEGPWAGRTDLIKSPPAAKPKPVDLPPIERFELDNGLKVRVVSDRSLPMATLVLVVQAGVDQEPRELRSLSQFAAFMLTKGTTSRTADQISETIDFVGGGLNAWAGGDGTFVSCLSLSKDLATCLDLLPDVVLRPVFPEDEMGQVKDQLLAMVKRVRDSDAELASEHFANLLWGEDHIRGWPSTAKSVNAITRKDLVAWHADHFKPNNAILAVAGDVDPAAIKDQLTKAFESWKKGEIPKEKTYAEPKWKGLKVRLVDKPDQTQSQIAVGHLGLAHADPDFFATSLMNYTLGSGGFASRLMKVVRSEGGKTYGARSSFDAGKDRGAFRATTFTRNAETVATLKLVLGELEKMRAEGPTEAELSDARANLAGRYPLKLETVQDVSKALLGAELDGLDEAYVREYPVRVDAVSLAQTKAAAAKRLQKDDLVVVIVGKAEDVEPQLKETGWKYEKVGYLEPTTATERKAKAAELEGPADPKKTEEGRRLLDEALAAKGGADKLKAIKDITIQGKGTIAAQGQKFDAEVTGYFVVPDKRRVDIKIPMGVITSVVTPDGAWGGMGAMVRDAPPATAEEERISLWRHKDLILLHHLSSADLFVQARDQVIEGGKTFDVIELRKPDNSMRTMLWLDAKSHHVSRMEYEKKGDKAVEYYEDYRSVDGLMMAFKQRQEGAGSKVELTLSEVKLNAGVAADMFDKPKPPDSKPK